MSADHPDHELLEQYALGGLEGTEARDVGAHIRGCSECQKTLAEDENLLGNLTLLFARRDILRCSENAVMARIPSASGTTASRRGSIRHPPFSPWPLSCSWFSWPVISRMGLLWRAENRAGGARFVPDRPGRSRVNRRTPMERWCSTPRTTGAFLPCRGLKRLDASHVYRGCG